MRMSGTRRARYKRDLCPVGMVQSESSGLAQLSDEEEEVLRVASLLEQLHIPEDDESKLDQVSTTLRMLRGVLD